MTEQRKAVIKNADMSEDMQQDAVDIASQALAKYNIEKVSRFLWGARRVACEGLKQLNVSSDIVNQKWFLTLSCGEVGVLGVISPGQPLDHDNHF